MHRERTAGDDGPYTVFSSEMWLVRIARASSLSETTASSDEHGMLDKLGGLQARAWTTFGFFGSLAGDAVFVTSLAAD